MACKKVPEAGGRGSLIELNKDSARRVVADWIGYHWTRWTRLSLGN